MFSLEFDGIRALEPVGFLEFPVVTDDNHRLLCCSTLAKVNRIDI